MNLLPWGPGRPERTEAIHRLTQEAFAPYATLARPSGALGETVDDVEADLAAGGGLLVYDDTWTTPLGALRWRIEDDHLWVKRVAVDPAHQGQGIGNYLMDACQGLGYALQRDRIRLGVRHALTENRRWYERRGYRPVAEHDDWTEYEAALEPITFVERATVWKYEHPDHLQGTFEVDVLEESAEGTWVRIPQFMPSMGSDRTIWMSPYEIVGWLPVGEWWTAWFSHWHRRIKVDICTPFQRRDDGDFEFGDLCLDVLATRDRPAWIDDEDEFAAACYEPDIAARARASADDVLRRILEGEEPFATEGFARLSR